MKYPHWQYYRSLCEDVERLSRYVALIPDNLGASSIECTRLLLAASSEVDVVCKVLCEKVEPGCNPRDIVDFGRILLPKYPGIPEVLVSIPRFSLQLQPWDGWTLDTRPNWWQDYNKVKHHRHQHADLGNLGNALNSVAALCVLLCYLYYADFISNGLATRQPFMFLDSCYRVTGNRLRSWGIVLPDFCQAPDDRE